MAKAYWKVKRALVGSTDIYGGTHQYGNPKKNIPARPYLGINEDNKQEIEEEIISYLESMAAL
ncbi:Phage virion morphogenesis family protein [Candidatus Hepatincolaceae symbiont of Richtersius coronifer]